MKKREAGRGAVPFGNQAPILGLRAKAVADEVCLCRDYGVRFALILRQTADKVENQMARHGPWLCGWKAFFRSYRKGREGRKGAVLSIWYLAASPRRCCEGPMS